MFRPGGHPCPLRVRAVENRLQAIYVVAAPLPGSVSGAIATAEEVMTLQAKKLGRIRHDQGGPVRLSKRILESMMRISTRFSAALLPLTARTPVA